LVYEIVESGPAVPFPRYLLTSRVTQLLVGVRVTCLSRMRSSSLLSARISSWLGCGRPRARCHCLSRYAREQSTCRPRAVVGGQRQNPRSSTVLHCYIVFVTFLILSKLLHFKYRVVYSNF